ncbi:MAG: glucose-6-phosphate isomerase [Planctomycetota bacterium]
MSDVELSKDYPIDLPSWASLSDHYLTLRERTLVEIAGENNNRFEEFSVSAGDLLLDYSKNYLTAETLARLLALADEAQLRKSIDAMFAGEHINVTEDRAVLHTALRAAPGDAVGGDEPGVDEVGAVLDRVANFVASVHGGEIVGATGKRLRHIVNIGIGGSDLGPVMASRALRSFWQPGMHFHSASNVDGTQLVDLRASLNVEETLFVVCSKTFTTQETMTNAQAARAWVVEALGENAVIRHFAAASTNHAAMDEFGVDPSYRFGFWDWVGGRYSLWSAVGLSLALVIGMVNFRRLLSGGRTMDLHFRGADFVENLPVLLGLISVWYNSFFGADSQVILPYDNRLDRFPAYLQQLQMESSGKSVRKDGEPVATDTGMVIWGEAGNNAQHSFYQLLHQGTRFVSADFLLPVRSSGATQAQQDLAIANCLAQSEALMNGYDADDRFRFHAGGRPSNTILFNALTPEVLGQLIALYEHKVFVENAIWGVNAFDQFGVELGKKLARRLEGPVGGTDGYSGDSTSTRGLLARIRELR